MKDDRSKIRKDQEEVIQEMKGADKVGNKNVRDDLESAIKEESGKKGDYYETARQENLF